MKRIFMLFLIAPFYTNAAVGDISINDVSLNQTTTGLYELSGVATNKSNKGLKDVFVTYALYDGGYKVAELVDGVGVLKPNEKWKFSMISPYKFNRYKLQSIVSH
ncbi:FxLYD domain-containing protein [Photobacterium damselae]|uniref:FxLYD domain-containing protein n=1 Tax=Photobacterium damselae TaxID=38293 RepID=UPI0040681543